MKQRRTQKRIKKRILVPTLSALFYSTIIIVDHFHCLILGENPIKSHHEGFVATDHDFKTVQSGTMPWWPHLDSRNQSTKAELVFIKQQSLEKFMTNSNISRGFPLYDNCDWIKGIFQRGEIKMMVDVLQNYYWLLILVSIFCLYNYNSVQYSKNTKAKEGPSIQKKRNKRQKNFWNRIIPPFKDKSVQADISPAKKEKSANKRKFTSATKEKETKTKEKQRWQKLLTETWAKQFHTWTSLQEPTKPSFSQDTAGLLKSNKEQMKNDHVRTDNHVCQTHRPRGARQQRHFGNHLPRDTTHAWQRSKRTEGNSSKTHHQRIGHMGKYQSLTCRAVCVKTTQDSLAYTLPQKYECSKSVGILHRGTNFQFGTGFHVGTNKICTSLHTVLVMLQLGSNLSYSDRRLTSLICRDISSCSITFYYYSPLNKGRQEFKFLPKVHHLNQSHGMDIIILEIEVLLSTGKPPKSLKSFGHLEPLEPFQIYGHPNGDPMKIDQECKQVVKCQRQLQQYEQEMSQLFTSTGFAGPVRPPYEDLIYIERSSYLFDTFIKEGGSGGPGIVIVGEHEYKVVTMLIGILPHFYCSVMPQIQQQINPDAIFNYGVAMLAVYKDIKLKNPPLCQDIFRNYPLAWDL